MTKQDAQAHRVEVRLTGDCRYALSKIKNERRVGFVGVCMALECYQSLCPVCGTLFKKYANRPRWYYCWKHAKEPE